MRKFMKIVESITDDMALNNEIEAKLSTHDEGDRTLILDGLEVVMSARQINVSEWVRRMKQMWPETTNDTLKRIFKIMIADYPNLVTRSGDGQYSWGGARHTNSDIEMDSPMAQMAKAQIEYTSMIIDLMQQSGTFTPQDITMQFAGQANLEVDMAAALVDHTISNSSANVKSIGDGCFRWVNPEQKTGLSFLRDLDGYQPRS
jgi:hypothetical protein